MVLFRRLNLYFFQLREKNMSSDVGNSVASGRNNSIVNNDYNTSTYDKNNYSIRPPSFNEDATQFSWSKSKMYHRIIRVDHEMWDIIEDGVLLLFMQKEWW